MGSTHFVTNFVKSFISLVFTNSDLFLFAFIRDVALICIPVYNLDPYEYFRRMFVEVLCYSFMRFAKVIISPIKLHKKISLHEKFIIAFIIEFLFLLSHMFPWMNKFLITAKMFLPRLVNRKAAVWWPITANEKSNNNLKLTKIEKNKIKNENEKIEKMKKVTKLSWPTSAKSDTQLPGFIYNQIRIFLDQL